MVAFEIAGVVNWLPTESVPTQEYFLISLLLLACKTALSFLQIVTSDANRVGNSLVLTTYSFSDVQFPSLLVAFTIKVVCSCTALEILLSVWVLSLFQIYSDAISVATSIYAISPLHTILLSAIVVITG